MSYHEIKFTTKAQLIALAVKSKAPLVGFTFIKRIKGRNHEFFHLLDEMPSKGVPIRARCEELWRALQCEVRQVRRQAISSKE